MKRIRLALLRGVCQLPAYVAMERGFFATEGIEAEPRWRRPPGRCRTGCTRATSISP